MSKGFCGYADLVQADNSMLLYSYCCYNLNRAGWATFKQMEDGELWIDRSALVEPEIHEKIIRRALGREKNIQKRIVRDYSLEPLFDTGRITVKNASGTWQVGPGDIDYVAWNIIHILFREYQSKGIVPDKITWYV